MRIALLDDNADHAAHASQALRMRGHDCTIFKHAAALLEQVRQHAVDGVLLDASAVDVTLLRQLRALAPGMPMLLVAERSAETEIVAALDAGANDYALKPLRRSELATRVQILMQRAYPGQAVAEEIRFGVYAFDRRTSRATLSGQGVDLTQKEFELALLLFRHLGRPLSRAYIQETIWITDQELPSRTIDTHVSRVRSKLRLRPENGFRLTPVYSYGYRLEQVTP